MELPALELMFSFSLAFLCLFFPGALPSHLSRFRFRLRRVLNCSATYFRHFSRVCVDVPLCSFISSSANFTRFFLRGNSHSDCLLLDRMLFKLTDASGKSNIPSLPRKELSFEFQLMVMVVLSQVASSASWAEEAFKKASFFPPSLSLQVKECQSKIRLDQLCLTSEVSASYFVSWLRYLYVTFTYRL